MKIIKSGIKHNRKLHGSCDECGCEVECESHETKTLIDRDTQPGMATQYVKCPECGEQYLWLK
jgi:NAD-dependent SIR2 family protein deacetylase